MTSAERAGAETEEHVMPATRRQDPRKSTKTTPAAAKKAAPAKAAPAAKKAAPSRAARNAAKLAVVPQPETAPVAETVEETSPPLTDPADDALSALRERAVPLREKGLTLAEIATELGVSPSVAREIVEGTPRATPPKRTRTATSTERVTNASVQVESADTVITCRSCGAEKPARQFPTITGPLHRGTECRKCRDTRRDAAAVTTV
jgi:predicted transcriptional regulator